MKIPAKITEYTIVVITVEVEESEGSLCAATIAGAAAMAASASKMERCMVSRPKHTRQRNPRGGVVGAKVGGASGTHTAPVDSGARLLSVIFLLDRPYWRGNGTIFPEWHAAVHRSVLALVRSTDKTLPR